MEFCCERLAHEIAHTQSFSPSAIAYAGITTPPTGQIEQTDTGDWAVNGCCGGGCYVLTDIKFCPFCGTELPK